LPKHLAPCESGKELRVVLLIRRGDVSLDNWTINDDNQASFIRLCDALIEQHHFISEEICCKQEELTVKAWGVLDQMVIALRALPKDQREDIIFSLKHMHKLPAIFKANLRKEDTFLIAMRSSSTEGRTLVTQPLIPHEANDLSNESICKWLKYCNHCISTDHDLRMGSWPDDFMTYVTNRWVSLQDPRPPPHKRLLWKEKSAKEMKEMLTSFLPKGHALSTMEELGKTALDTLRGFLTENPLTVTFSVNSEQDFINFQNSVSAIQVKWNKIQKEGIAVDSQTESLMAKNLWKKFDIVPPLEGASVNQFKLEIQGACHPLKQFIPVLEAIDEITSAQFRLIQKVQEFIPNPSRTKNKWDIGNKPNAPTGDTPAGKKQKRNGRDAYGAIPLQTQPKASICKGCGWTTKPDRKPGDTGRPARYQCMRNGIDGCTKDPRRNPRNSPWAESEVGLEWKQHGYDSLPKDVTIVLQNASERRKTFVATKKPSRADSHGKAKYGKATMWTNYSNDLLLTNELIPFSLSGVQDLKKQRIQTSGDVETSGEKLEIHPYQ
jgi:hypothetical protein